jgi:RNA polymerase sporulation-specific sigma factor
MSKQQDIDLATAAQAGDKVARFELLNKYERLCHKLARKFGFTATNHDHEDLVQEGRIGLLKAVDTYDQSHGASFMTWAYYHVRGSIASAGRVDRKQPAYPRSIEDCPRAYNVEDPAQEIKVRDDLPRGIVRKIIEECCGGLHTKRAKIVMDRYGLLGHKELRNCECAEKYGITKYAVTSHTSSFKRKARLQFPHLADFV